MRLTTGQQAPGFHRVDTRFRDIRLDDYKNKKLLLCFFRNAGCPFCDVAFLDVLERYEKLTRIGLDIIAFFQSPRSRVLRYVTEKYNPPFPVIADPRKSIYTRYGIESSLLACPESVLKIPGEIADDEMVPGAIDGDPHMIPASFLIGAPELTVYETYYGKNFMDAICLEDIMDFVRAENKWNF